MPAAFFVAPAGVTSTTVRTIAETVFLGSAAACAIAGSPSLSRLLRMMFCVATDADLTVVAETAVSLYPVETVVAAS